MGAVRRPVSMLAKASAAWGRAHGCVGCLRGCLVRSPQLAASSVQNGETSGLLVVNDKKLQGPMRVRLSVGDVEK